jgi:hypothetical protein
VTARLCDTVERWGATDEEIRDSWPGDELGPVPDRVLYRAVDVAAAPATVFRWLCQLRDAPYSYDWIDNYGRPSPRTLTPGLEDLSFGQVFCTIFRLAAFAPDDHIVLTSRTPVFGDVVITYRVRPAAEGARLAVKLRIRYPAGPLGWLGRLVLPAGDLVMMRKQLLTLAALAERTPAPAVSGG